MKWLNNWIDQRLRNRDRTFMEATARKAASDAIHYYTAVRTTERWREIIDEADKEGTDKYLSMADLIVKSGFKK